jgi:hypothetical protein
MTTVSLTSSQMEDRLRADKIALEGKLRDVFNLRKHANDGLAAVENAERIKALSAQLRAVKKQLEKE